METTTDLKIAQTSRPAIDALDNSKEEFKALIDRMNNDVLSLSQQVRLAKDAADPEVIGRINKLKLNSKQLQDLLTQMEAMDETAWEVARPAAELAYVKAAAVNQ